MSTSQPEKAKRPDVAKRLKEGKDKVRNVVKASLPGRLGTDWGDQARAILREELDKTVLSCSQITHRMSLIWNRMLLFLLHNNRPIPKIVDSLFTGLAKSGMKKTSKQSKEEFSDLIDDFVANEFCDYPHITRQRGDCQAITIAARRYKTNFLNSCYVPFYKRQKAYVYLWCKMNGVDEADSYKVWFKINGWEEKKKKEKKKKKGGKKDRGKTEVEIKEENDNLSSRIESFVAAERQILNNPSNLTDQDLKKLGPEKVLTYYFRILKYYDEHGQGKKFSLAPVCRIRKQFLSIDSTALYELLKNVISDYDRSYDKDYGQIPDLVRSAIDPKSKPTETITLDVWKSVFDYTGLRSRRQFEHQIDTDGVSICFHFFYTNKKAHDTSKDHAKTEQGIAERFIAIDPGRANIIEAYEYNDDPQKRQYYRFTGKQYYRESGMTRRFKQKKLRMTCVSHIHNRMCATPVRSINEKDWYGYQQIITRNYKTLWDAHTQVADQRDDLRVYSLKQKCLDRFFSTFLCRDKIKPTIAYGAAYMTPTGKGEMSVPVRFVYKKCCDRFDTIKVNEDYTTLMHAKCQNYTHSVKCASSHIRSLRWCPTCRELVSRDRNACHNIAAVYLAGDERPKYMCRASHVDRPKFPAFDLGGRVANRAVSTKVLPITVSNE